MAKAKKQSSRGRKQDRARVAGGQDYEVRYAAKKTRKSASAVKKAVKKVGQQPQAGRASAWTLGTRIEGGGLSDIAPRPRCDTSA